MTACTSWSQASVDEFVRGLQHPNLTVRALSARNLGYLTDDTDAAVTALEAAAYDDVNATVRFEATKSIGQIASTTPH